MSIRKIETPARGCSVPSNYGPVAANGSRPARRILDFANLATHWARLATLTLVAALFVATWWAPDPPRIASAGPGSGLIGWGYPPGMSRDWYISHHQWRADTRTALAALRFILSPDLDNWIPPFVPLATPFFSATTNSGTNMPNV